MDKEMLDAGNRVIKNIVIHCSASQIKSDIGVKEIRKMHTDKGWSDIGYHFVIRLDGTLEVGRPLSRSGAHVRGYNKNSIGICIVGGIDSKGKPQDNKTVEQEETLALLLSALNWDHPDADIKGHRDFPGVNKACPCFDVHQWLTDKGFYLSNI